MENESTTRVSPLTRARRKIKEVGHVDVVIPSDELMKNLKEAEDNKLPAPKAENMDLELDLLADERNYEKQMAEKLSKEEVHALKRLGYYLSEIGMDFTEACVLVRYEPEEMKALIEANDFVMKWIRLKEMILKKNLMKTVSYQAINLKNEKLATWMLEKKYSEFSRKPSKDTGEDGLKLIGAMVQTVRDSKNNGLVSEKKSIVFMKRDSENANEDKIDEVKQTISNLLQ